MMRWYKAQSCSSTWPWMFADTHSSHAVRICQLCDTVHTHLWAPGKSWVAVLTPTAIKVCTIKRCVLSPWEHLLMHNKHPYGTKPPTWKEFRRNNAVYCCSCTNWNKTSFLLPDVCVRVIATGRFSVRDSKFETSGLGQQRLTLMLMIHSSPWP